MLEIYQKTISETIKSNDINSKIGIEFSIERIKIIELFNSIDICSIDILGTIFQKDWKEDNGFFLWNTGNLYSNEYCMILLLFIIYEIKYNPKNIKNTLSISRMSMSLIYFHLWNKNLNKYIHFWKSNLEILQKAGEELSHRCIIKQYTNILIAITEHFSWTTLNSYNEYISKNTSKSIRILTSSYNRMRQVFYSNKVYDDEKQYYVFKSGIAPKYYNELRNK